MTAKEYIGTIDQHQMSDPAGKRQRRVPGAFQRQDATLEQIEGIHWDKPTLGGKFNTLPKGRVIDDGGQLYRVEQAAT